jgi:hypothetical protein
MRRLVTLFRLRGLMTSTAHASNIPWLARGDRLIPVKRRGVAGHSVIATLSDLTA